MSSDSSNNRRLDVIEMIFSGSDALTSDSSELLEDSDVLVETESEEQILRRSVKASVFILQAISPALLLFQYQPPKEIFFLNCNPETTRLMGLDRDDQGTELEEMWPLAGKHGLTLACLEAARNGEPFEMEKMHFRKGRIERILRVKGFPLPGNRLGLACDDITERARADQALRSDCEEEEPVSTDKDAETPSLPPVQHAQLSDIRTAQEELAGATAQYLSPVIKTLEEASRRGQSRLDAGYISLVKASFRKISTSAEKISEVVRRLRQFSGNAPVASALERRVVDLSELVREELPALRQTFEDEGKVHEPDNLSLTESCLVEGERSDLADVVAVLLKNALEDATLGAGITVKTFRQDNMAVLQVENNGSGIQPDDATRVFDPFWTSKSAHAGLGLSAAAGIIHRYGGSIAALPQEGPQSVFIVKLPLAEEKA